MPGYRNFSESISFPRESAIFLCAISNQRINWQLSLDEILEKKVELSQMLSNRLKQQQEEYFVEFSMTGIKDIILPGEISVAGKGDLVEQLGQLVGTK